MAHIFHICDATNPARPESFEPHFREGTDISPISNEMWTLFSINKLWTDTSQYHRWYKKHGRLVPYTKGN